jgi:hypothetical protein
MFSEYLDLLEEHLKSLTKVECRIAYSQYFCLPEKWIHYENFLENKFQFTVFDSIRQKELILEKYSNEYNSIKEENIYLKYI